MKKHLLTLCLTLLMALQATAQDPKPTYNASKFGIRSDGVTMNTRSIQFAIDWIAEQGGGTLRFWVGRYLTGSIHLKSNVTIELMEGAVLVGSTNPFDYDRLNATNDHGLILAEGVENIRLIGVYNSGGVIEGQGRELGNNCTDLVHKGLMKDKLSNDRVGEGFRPRLLIFRECKNVEVDNVTFRNAANWVTMYDQCENVKVNNIRIQSTAFWNNDGIDIVDCDGFVLTNSYIDASDDAICLSCGNYLTDDGAVVCDSCTGTRHSCARCGDYYNEDDMTYKAEVDDNLSGTEDDGVYAIAGLLRDGDDGKEPDIDRISDIANSWIFLD